MKNTSTILPRVLTKHTLTVHTNLTGRSGSRVLGNPVLKLCHFNIPLNLIVRVLESGLNYTPVEPEDQNIPKTR